MAEDFGKRVKEARLKAGMTQSQLAEKMDVSVNHISAIERGVYETRTDTLKKLVTELGTSADYLLFGVRENSSPLDDAFLRASRLSEGKQEWVARYLDFVIKNEQKIEEQSE